MFFDWTIQLGKVQFIKKLKDGTALYQAFAYLVKTIKDIIFSSHILH